MKSTKHWLNLQRTVYFGECDPAGVLHFYHLYRWCHESWEESLRLFGINVTEVFPTSIINKEKIKIFLPIVHSEARYKSIICSGDILNILLSPTKISSSSFNVDFNFTNRLGTVATASLRHVSIENLTRERTDLPIHIINWLEG